MRRIGSWGVGSRGSGSRGAARPQHLERRRRPPALPRQHRDVRPAQRPARRRPRVVHRRPPSPERPTRCPPPWRPAARAAAGLSWQPAGHRRPRPHDRHRCGAPARQPTQHTSALRLKGPNLALARLRGAPVPLRLQRQDALLLCGLRGARARTEVVLRGTRMQHIWLVDAVQPYPTLTPSCAQVSVIDRTSEIVRIKTAGARKQGADSALNGATCGSMLAGGRAAGACSITAGYPQAGRRCSGVAMSGRSQVCRIARSPQYTRGAALLGEQGAAGRASGSATRSRRSASATCSSSAASSRRSTPACAHALHQPQRCAGRAARRSQFDASAARPSGLPGGSRPCSAAPRRALRASQRVTAKCACSPEALRGGGRRGSAPGSRTRGGMRTHSGSALRRVYAAGPLVCRRPSSPCCGSFTHLAACRRARGQLYRTSTSSPPQWRHLQQ
jgi:hypothetical protein